MVSRHIGLTDADGWLRVAKTSETPRSALGVRAPFACPRGARTSPLPHSAIDRAHVGVTIAGVAAARGRFVDCREVGSGQHDLHCGEVLDEVAQPFRPRYRHDVVTLSQ